LLDTLAIRYSQGRGRDGWLEVWHHNGSRKLSCRIANHGTQSLGVAQMEVPIVGACDGERRLSHAE
jgi:hypothetical protein